MSECYGRLGGVAMAMITLSACGHDGGNARPEPIVAPVEVAMPVATGCVPANMAKAPEYPDSDQALKAAPGAAERYQLLYAGRKVRSARLAEIEPVLANCPRAAAK